MSTKPGSKDEAVPPKPAYDSTGNADASPPAFLEQIFYGQHPAQQPVGVSQP